MNPEKRLIEISTDWYNNDVYYNGSEDRDGAYHPGTPDENDHRTLADSILQEFKHKDSLPTGTEIAKRILDWDTARKGYGGDPKYRNITLGRAIRNLIEGR